MVSGARFGGALGLILIPSLALPDLVINEFLADPAGSDSGQEFVELINNSSMSVSLAEVRLQFGNGIEGAVWTTRWTGDAEAILESGQRFLLVDRNWQGEEVTDDEVYLGLQNGPDALRLVRGEQVLDTVGYGALTDSEMMESAPAPIQTGLSTARRPDGFDSQVNALDFVLHNPTPGQPNFDDFALEILNSNFDPPCLDRPGPGVTVTVSLENTGLLSWPSGRVFLEGLNTRGESWLDACLWGDERTVTWIVPDTREGRFPMRVLFPHPALEDTLTVFLGWFQVGSPQLYLNEVMSMPGAGQGEWVELRNQGVTSISLGTYQLRDEDGSWQYLPSEIIQPGQLVVLAQDESNLLGWTWANSEAGDPNPCSLVTSDCRLVPLGSWPNLNNSPPADRDFSDRVYLADSLGTVLDQVLLGSPGQENLTGRSWERVEPSPSHQGASNWMPNTGQAGSSPGCPNSVSSRGTPAAVWAWDPRVLQPDEGISAQHLQFEVVTPGMGYTLRIFNTWGEVVRDFGGDQAGPGPRDLVWDGRDDRGILLSQGAYLAVVHIRDSNRATLKSHQLLSVIQRSGGS